MRESQRMNDLEVKDKLLSVKVVAQILSLSSRSVHRLNTSGRIPKPVKINGAVRWRKSDIEQWMLWVCPDRKTFEARKGDKV